MFKIANSAFYSLGQILDGNKLGWLISAPFGVTLGLQGSLGGLFLIPFMVSHPPGDQLLPMDMGLQENGSCQTAQELHSESPHCSHDRCVCPIKGHSQSKPNKWRNRALHMKREAANEFGHFSSTTAGIPNPFFNEGIININSCDSEIIISRGPLQPLIV